MSTQPYAAPHSRPQRPRRTAELLAAGIPRRELTGPTWTSPTRGIHVWSAAATADPLTRIMAAAALMPSGSVIGGWAALYLLGVADLDGRTGPGAGRELPVMVCIGPVGRMRPRSGIVIDRSTLLARDVTAAGGIGVTSGARSCVDIMCRDGVEEGVVAADAAARFGVASPKAVRAYVATRAGMRGVPAARVAAGLLDPRSASRPESRFRVVWVLDAGLPLPLVNSDLVDQDGVLLGEADLFDPAAALAGEYDGQDHRDLRQHTADNIREEGFERHNITVVRATAIDLWPRRRELVARLQAAYRDGLARDRRRDRWGIRRR